MHLSRLTISNFRKLKHVTLNFKPGLNVLVGANNVGKTAVIDALRALMDESFPRLTDVDIHRPEGEVAAGPDGEAATIVFDYVFADLTADDEAGLIPALVRKDQEFQAWFRVEFGSPDASGRLRPRRTCGEHNASTMTVEQLEDLRGVYLPALRDASYDLRPGRLSKLARLFKRVVGDNTSAIDSMLKEHDSALKNCESIVGAKEEIVGGHTKMLGVHLSQTLDVELSASDFRRLASRLSLLVDSFAVEQNGLGFNNLIFMAVVLSDLSANADSLYRPLIVEEPESHLHPQLQGILLHYLEGFDLAEIADIAGIPLGTVKSRLHHARRKLLGGFGI